MGKNVQGCKRKPVMDFGQIEACERKKKASDRYHRTGYWHSLSENNEGAN